ncbi:polysaccharide pyruvyl transferase family protein [uncultured Fusobacterium sp.]|uniref:polysaccharide pyruvyl transferase family protein n=1 Tax=uncultured Fusobacterium sp. TaxID=159267 RepID=UPI0025F3EDD4|nr:polysaccharide pyruvyl transferase family protein [uncultured Fusobacterium sp.]
MKIGILTFQYANNRNFGASLQSFACKSLIEKIARIKETKVINYNPTNFNFIKKVFHYFTGLAFNDYNNKFLNLSKEIYNKKELEELNNNFDIFIVGSDQVWRTIWLKEKSLHYFFDFVNDNKKKIAYAASFGVDFWEGDEKLTEKIKSLIKRFDSISVREESGIDICKDTFGIDNVVCVLDPTLMISKEDYQPILDDWKDKNHLKKKYIAHMLLDDTKDLKDGSKKIADYLKAEINYIKGKSIKILGKEITFYNKVSQWLTYLKDAELVITDSFHCTVFSLIFHKKFVVVANPVRGVARLETLLGKVGLKDRFFTNIEAVMKSGILDKDIDYNEVDEKLEVHRKYSMEFLKKALGVK